MADPGLPLTTGEGNTARERAENTLSKTPGPRASDAQTLARDVLALLAECGRLREQLDAARQLLEAIVAESSHTMILTGASLARARAALGVEAAVREQEA